MRMCDLSRVRRYDKNRRTLYNRWGTNRVLQAWNTYGLIPSIATKRGIVVSFAARVTASPFSYHGNNNGARKMNMNANNKNEKNHIDDDEDTGYLYRVLNPAMFRVLAKRYESAHLELVDPSDESLSYRITGDDLIKDALELDVIAKTEPGSGVCTLNSPHLLIELITSVEQHVYDDDDTEYIVHTKRGDLKIKGCNIFDAAAWKLEAFLKCNILLSYNRRQKGISEAMDDLAIYISDHADTVWNEEMTRDDMTADIIMSEVEKLQIVEKREDFEGFTALSEDGVFYIQSKTLKSIVDGMNYTFDSALRKTLRDRLAKPSKQIWILNRRMSVWQFTPWGVE